jgi:thiopurine S-methyltransferase
MNPDEWKQYWLERWNQKNTRWHQDEFEPLLLQHFPQVAPTTVLVPLCGKTKDMIYLASKGHQVIGVELSELACQAFFEENNLKYQLSVEGDFKVFTSESIRIFCGDLFKLRAEQVPGLGAVYDRAAMIALPQELRSKYVTHLTQLLSRNKQGFIFLIAIDYSGDRNSGPPFAVSEEEIRSLYSEHFQMKKLSNETHEIQLNSSDDSSKRMIVESAYLIK